MPTKSPAKDIKNKQAAGGCFLRGVYLVKPRPHFRESLSKILDLWNFWKI